MKTRSGYLFTKKPGGTWYCRVKVNGRMIVKSTGETSKTKAEKKRAEILRPYVIGDNVAVLKAVAARIQESETEAAQIEADQNPPPEIGRVWMRFLQSPSRPDSGESTLGVYEFKWKRFLRWLASDHPEVNFLHDITPAMAADYARDLTAAKFSASSFNQHRNLLRMVWRVMADECRLDGNPWDKITPRKLNALANRKRALTPGQYENLLATVETSDSDLHDLFVMLAWTGLRLADAVLMKWTSVDFKQRVISLAPIKTARRQGKVVHIPLFPAAAAVLDKRQSGKVLNPAAFVFPDLAATYERDPSAVSKRIQNAFERAGIETTVERADRGRRAVVYGAHSFRHLFVSAAAAAGIPAAMIKSITGHATDSMLEHYQHIGADLASEFAIRVSGKSPVAPAVVALPVGGNDKGRNAEATIQHVKATLEGMNAETWEADRAALLEICG